jgi:hypothetical protein
MTVTPLAVARACLRAYIDKDRAALEALLDASYRFTSPLDNALDRRTYLEICWPNSELIAGFDIVYELEDCDRAMIVYEGRTTAGKRFRNCEVYTVRDAKLVATEVYFGWDLPHQVAPGAHAQQSRT